jgi:hypothetical protein
VVEINLLALICVLNLYGAHRIVKKGHAVCFIFSPQPSYLDQSTWYLEWMNYKAGVGLFFLGFFHTPTIHFHFYYSHIITSLKFSHHEDLSFGWQ